MRQRPGGRFASIVAPVVRAAHRRHGPNQSRPGPDGKLSEEWRGEPRWYDSDTPPRRHNRITPLVHGHDYFTDLCHELSRAGQRVTVAGWCLTPSMALLRQETGLRALSDVLAEVAERVDIYVLIWAGAPALFKPDRKAAEEAQARLLAA